MKIHALRTIATRTATAVGAAVIGAVVVAGSLSVAQAATEAIAPNSITSGMIRDGAVKSVDIKDGAVTGTDLKDGTVTGVDIANGTITSADVDPSIARPRLAVFVDGTGVVGQLSTSNSTGVASVTNPGVGLYCITPSVPLDLSSSVPIVVGEFYFTAGVNGMISHAGWDATHESCPATDIGVRGWNAAGNFNDVSFTVTVP